MALPLLLAVPALLAIGGFGVKKGVDAHKDTKKAKELNSAAQDLFHTEKGRLEGARRSSTQTLEKLGRQKLGLWDRQLGRFVGLFERIRNVELSGAARVNNLGAAAFSAAELAEMKALSGYATEVVGGGATALGSGALVGMASYGGAMMFASASTGTAIASLGGVAATNATLAWFGGGSLAAGGLGMAGGTAVLGGIVAAPVLAVAGAVWAAKARKNLAEAKSNHAKARRAAAEMKAATAVVKGIQQAANGYRKLLNKFDPVVTSVLDHLEATLAEHGTNYRTYPQTAQERVYVAVQFAQGLKALLEAPLLTKSGALRSDHGIALSDGRKLLQSWA